MIGAADSVAGGPEGVQPAHDLRQTVTEQKALRESTRSGGYGEDPEGRLASREPAPTVFASEERAQEEPWHLRGGVIDVMKVADNGLTCKTRVEHATTKRERRAAWELGFGESARHGTSRRRDDERLKCRRA